MSADEGSGLGRLKELGLKATWQLPLLLPERWDDFRDVREHFGPLLDLGEGEKVVVAGRLEANPSSDFSNGRPRTRFRFADGAGYEIGVTLFGDQRDLAGRLAVGDRVVFHGAVHHAHEQKVWLRNATWVPPENAGRLMPVYPAIRGRIRAEAVRQRVQAELKEAIPVAARWIASEVSRVATHMGLPVATSPEQLERDLRLAHEPETPEAGHAAQKRLEMLAALYTLCRAYSANGGSARAWPLELGAWETRLDGVPFTLTGEQRSAVEAMVDQFRADTPQRHLLSGDVGTGKTVVFALVAAATVDAGRNVAILLPNEPLAQQVASEIREMWPDLRVVEVTGSGERTPFEDDEARLFVGTTALLSRLGEGERNRIGLVVIDEQQKYSVSQREHLAQHGAHLLEATATCIPRTMALIRYGAMEVSQLRQTPCEKNIVTEVVPPERRGSVFKKICRTVEKGYQALVVYPMKEGDQQDRMAVENAIKWWRKRFGDRALAITGPMEPEEKRDVLERMRTGRADVLIGTTVVEVGLNLPRLRHIVLADARRYGLSQIHQLRGRVARQGGTGLCSLVVPEATKDKVYERLAVLEATQDGFEVARHDLELRGFGDLGGGGGPQHGSDETFLFGRKIDMTVADRVAEEIQSRMAIRR